MLIITYFKFLFTIILIIPINIYALEFSEWREEVPKKENIVVESEIRYKWYENIIVNEHFDLFNEQTSHIIDLNNFKYTDYSLFSIIKPEEKPYREIEEELRTILCDDNKFNKIIFKNFTTTAKISEISIKNKTTNEDILYTLSGVYEGIPEWIDDGNFSKGSIDVTNETVLILEFDQEYHMNNINIFMYLTDNGLRIDSFKMIFLKDKYPISEKILIINTESGTCFADKCRMTINHNSSWPIQTIFSEKYYRYRDKLFRYYDIERKYIDGYYTNLDGYIKDETQSKKFYRYANANKSNTKVSESKSKTIISYFNNPKENREQKDIKNNIVEKIQIIDPKKVQSSNNNQNNSLIKIVVLGFILSFIFVMSRILYKKHKIRRAI